MSKTTTQKNDSIKLNDCHQPARESELPFHLQNSHRAQTLIDIQSK